MESKIQKALQFINENYQKNIDLTLISESCFISSSRLSHLFKKETGESISSYINKKRLEKALSLLLKSDKNISEIAYESGFSSIANFNRTFKKYFDISPSEYKKHSILCKENSLKLRECEKKIINNPLVNELCRRLSMVLNVDDSLLVPFITYCSSKGLDIQKVIQDLIVLTQVKNCIDQDGKIYVPILKHENNYGDIENILSRFTGDTKTFYSKEKIGLIYENFISKQVYYYIGQFCGYQIVVISEDKACKLKKKLEDIQVVDNQSFAWVTVYDQEVTFTRVKDTKEVVIIVP